MTQARNTTSGFTIIEVTLSMAFISMLLLAIALLTLQISAIYNKGLTTRAVNEAGQLISSDIQRTINESKSVGYATNPGDGTEKTGGRLCADLTVYAWNYGKSLKENGFNKFDNGDSRLMRLVKFPSGGEDYCTAVDGKYLDIPHSTVTDLLTAGDADLAVHKLTVNTTDGLTGQAVDGDTTGSQRIYEITLVVGTSEKSILESNVSNEGCADPNANGSKVDDQYCAVNEFVFTARTGNR